MWRNSAKRCAVCALLAALWLAGAAATASAQIPTGTTATGASREMNPALSVNGIFEAKYEDQRRINEQTTSLAVQEIELSAMSVVDPFFKASVFTSFHPPHHHHGEAEHEEEVEPEVDQVSVEEAFVQTLALPTGLGVRAGKMLVPFGRLNQIHLHHLPFIEASHGFHSIIGPHGQSDVGVELSVAPNVPWYLNLRLFTGDGKNELFDFENDELAVAARLENLWDLSEATTFELAGSVLRGPAAEGTRRTFYGADVRLKWRDIRKTYGKAFEWMTELTVDSPQASDDRILVDSYARVRVARTWWTGIGHSLLHDRGPGGETENEFKAQLAFVPSEYSAIRMEGIYLDSPLVGHVVQAAMQLNFTIGSHPAHLY